MAAAESLLGFGLIFRLRLRLHLHFSPRSEMAAYAAVISLADTASRIQTHPRLSAAFPNNQIQSLLHTARFLHHFLQTHSSAALEPTIAAAASTAEDLIESRAVDELSGAPLAGYWNKFIFSTKLKKAIDHLNSIQNSLQIHDTAEINDQQQQPPPVRSAATIARKFSAVGLDNDDLAPILDRLVSAHGSARQVIPVVGMGGIGKTTLAKALYENPLIKHHFDVRIWVLISQKFNFRDVLMQIPACRDAIDKKKLEKADEVLNLPQPHLADGNNDDVVLTDDELGQALHKSLFGRRYFVVIDDMWSADVWDSLRRFFPEVGGSTGRVIVTTRLANVAADLGHSSHEMNFLDEDKSWRLFCETTFVDDEGFICPIELEAIGRKIVEKCKGLPLTIVVIGGLLAKSRRTVEHWGRVASDINSVLNSEGDEHFLDILSLSYNHLPVHLKPCFLYMGIYLEDSEIHVSRLVMLWDAEGFLKPEESRRFEDVARGYLKDLVDRNLVLVRRWKFDGKIKTCYVHDLLRELCLRVARKEKFLHVVSETETDDNSIGVNRKHRVVIHERISSRRDCPRVVRTMDSARVVRSLICEGGKLPLRSKLLRVLENVDLEYVRDVSKHLNLRYISYNCRYTWIFNLPSTIHRLWNLQTLICRTKFLCFAPPEIWEMQKLKHVEFHGIHLPDPPPRRDILRNLQTLSNVVNFKCGEEIVRQIPGVKKLKIRYDESLVESTAVEHFCLNKLDQLQTLETLYVSSCIDLARRRDLFLTVAFPSSLKKLTLRSCALCWNDLTTIGPLPCLEVLVLEDTVRGDEWHPVEEQFQCLKMLEIYACLELTCWNVDSSHFPVLQNLDFGYIPSLEEIPSEIGDIPTLQSVELGCCSASLAISVMKMLEEQESYGNEGLQVRVAFSSEGEQKRFFTSLDNNGSFRSKNFHVANRSSSQG
ncbi:putative late blight resistance protein homolog R1B-16 [Andrographis paniculata]|uniref:putative late blight resistance protein homolog R1B-16 n=1 Tax=Andrographis paniculata TaxID=175694 RepID=UPI0021E7335A|nr:putative late blight resistance protein homolog R1B-16 [Andrographis paniculata]